MNSGSGMRCGSVSTQTGGRPGPTARPERRAAKRSLRRAGDVGLYAIAMTHNPPDTVSQRRALLLSDISNAAVDVARDRRPVLVAVSKKQPDHRIEAALADGQRVFGENRVQEAMQRWSSRKEYYPDLELRLVGPLQTNKCDDAVALFDVIETLDRPKLARALAKSMAKLRRKIPVLIQVNTGAEPQKSGVLQVGLPDLLAVAKEEQLDVAGLMCIPPAAEPAGPHFALLKRLADQYALPTVSMGMSGDYATAIKFGATHVRIGSAFFGERIDG